MLPSLKPLGLVGVGIVPGTLRYPVGLARALLKPTDYGGLRLGEQQSNVAAAAFRALGASAVPFAVGVSIASLDGAEQGYGNLGGETGTRHVTVTSNVVLWPRPLVIFASDRTLPGSPRLSGRSCSRPPEMRSRRQPPASGPTTRSLRATCAAAV